MSFDNLDTVTSPVPLVTLDSAQIQSIQRCLSLIGYPIGDIDGMIGPKTKTAWANFKKDIIEGNPDLIGPGSVARLKEKANAVWPANYGLDDKESTIDAIKMMCQAMGLSLVSQMAYILATVEWETAKTFRPVREAFWHDESWRKKNFKYYPYYGRGYVQLTWKNNYERYAKILDLNLSENPDLALEPNTSLFILVHGFKTGIFTGFKLTEYINQNHVDFVGARHCINGTDHQYDIANLAHKYL